MYTDLSVFRAFMQGLVTADVADATITAIINASTDAEINAELNGGSAFTTVPDLVKAIEIRLGLWDVAASVYPRLEADPPARLRDGMLWARKMMERIKTGAVPLSGLTVSPVYGPDPGDDLIEEAIFVGDPLDWADRDEARA